MFRASDASKEWLKWNKEWVITVEALWKYEAPFWNNLKLYNGIFFTSASILSFFCYSSNLCFRSPFPAPPPFSFLPLALLPLSPQLPLRTHQTSRCPNDERGWRKLADWLNNLLNRVTIANAPGPIGEQVSKTAGRHTNAPTCTYVHTVAVRVRLHCQSRREQHILKEADVSLTLLKNISSLLAVSVSTVYIWSLQVIEGKRVRKGERDWEKEEGEMRRGQTAADSQNSTNNKPISFLPSLFSPCRQQTASENGALYKLCSNFKKWQ